MLLVAIPMIAIAFLVANVAGDSASGKTDAALAEDLELATGLYDDRVAAAKRAGTAIAADSQLQQAIAERDRAALEARLKQLVAEKGVRTYEFEGGAGLGSLGNTDQVGAPFAAATISLAGAGDGRLVVSTTLPDDYLHDVSRATGERTVVLTGDGEVVASLEIDAEAVPEGGEAADFSIGDEEFRAAAAVLPGSGGGRVALVAPVASGGFFASTPKVVAAFAAFILVALIAAGLLTRTLQRQVGLMLAAARRIGQGDFSGEVPVIGSDEMAGLASEFNEMRDKLSARVEQLKRQRTELERSVNRIGEAFASGLDAEALLPILAETAVGACEADYALIALTGQIGGEHETEPASEELRDAALEAEREVRRSGEPHRRASNGVDTISAPLGRRADERKTLGV